LKLEAAAVFKSTASGTRTGVLTDRAMTQSDSWRMLKRRARDAGISDGDLQLPSARPASLPISTIRLARKR